MEEPAKMCWNEVKDGLPVTFVGSCGDNPFRFMQEDIYWNDRSQGGLSRDADFVFGIHHRSQIANEMAIDRNLAFSDESLAGAP